MTLQFTATTIASIQQNSIALWEKNGLSFLERDFCALVEQNHSFNYQLWLAEDCARRDDCGAQFVYDAKRAIDGFNQQRNNCMEKMDAWLFQSLQPADPNGCPLHSETPGMIIDRMSILALKNHFMSVQATRADATDAHRDRCAKKLQTLALQQQRLVSCLDELFCQVLEKKRTFCIYHQFKMYNDPNLNPELYAPKDKVC